MNIHIYLRHASDGPSPFPFPLPPPPQAVWDDAPFKAYRGHCSHVTSVRFSADDRRVFTVGSNDKAILQWRTVGVCLEDRPQDLKLLRKAAYVLQGRMDEANARNWQVETDAEGRMYARAGGQTASSFQRTSSASAEELLRPSTATANAPAPPLASIREEAAAPAGAPKASAPSLSLQRPSARTMAVEMDDAAAVPAAITARPLSRPVSKAPSARALMPSLPDDAADVGPPPPMPVVRPPPAEVSAAAAPSGLKLDSEDSGRGLSERAPAAATAMATASRAVPMPMAPLAPAGGSGRYSAAGAESVDFDPASFSRPASLMARPRAESDFPVHEEDPEEEIEED